VVPSETDRSGRGTRSGAALALIVCVSLPATAREHRAPAFKREFQLAHPCPSTGNPTGACPGYVKDHIVPHAAALSQMLENIEADLADSKLDAAQTERLR
jgi:hypothetical protein